MKNIITILILTFLISCSASDNKSKVELESIKIADLKIESMETFMNENSDYWSPMTDSTRNMDWEYETYTIDNIYNLSKGYSEVFYSSVNMQNSSLMLPQENIEHKTIILRVNRSYDGEEVINKIKNQLTETLGEPENVKVGLTQKPNVQQWIYNNHKIQIQKDEMFNTGYTIGITEQKDTPDF